MKTILLVDDHPMMRKGAIALLQTLPEPLQFLEAGKRVEAIGLLESHAVDAAVVDLVLGADDGIEFIKEITARFAGLKVLVMSMQPEVLYVERVMKAGGMGMVSKSEEPAEVLKAMQNVLRGEFYLSPSSNALILKKLLGRRLPMGESPVSLLSDRELHVFQMLGTGYSTVEIADHLMLSVKTIETHREKIKRKMMLKDARELVHAARSWVLGTECGG